MTGTHLTEQAKRRLRAELDMLRAQRADLAGGADDVDEVGDRADDAETLRRHDDAALLDDRIAELTRLLAGGHPPGQEHDDGLPAGTRLTLRHGDGEVETLLAVAMTEQLEPGQENSALTLDSPLGQALAGRQVGDRVRYDAPEGTREVEIVDIRRP